MGKKLPHTPRSKVKDALRRLWLRSRERAAALKAANRSCQHCGVKASVAKGKEQKVEVHHKNGVKNWDKVMDAVYEFLLVSPEELEVLCPECHKNEHLSNDDKK